MKIIYNIKWSFKQFRNYPLQAFINILGLAVGLTVFMLIVLYINHQKKIDQFHEHAENIYRLEHGFGGITPATFLDLYQDKVPEIKYSARMSFLNGLIQYQPEAMDKVQKGFNSQISMVDKDFFDLFTYPLVKGNLDEIFADASSIILSESLAKKLFGEIDPINKMITYDTENSLVVKGIMKDVPESSSLEFDAAIPLDYYKVLNNDQDFFSNWGRWMYETYFMFDQGANIQDVKTKLDDLLTDYYINSQGIRKDYKANQTLRPYSEIYFGEEMDRHKHGTEKHIIIFSIIAFFVLLIACINYVNISTALASSRFRALGIRKIVGAARKDIIKIILYESCVVAFIAVVLSVLITEFALPYFEDLTHLKIHVPYSWQILAILFILLPLVMGLIAGFYPSIYLSRFKLTEVVKGELISGKSGSVFRKVLTILQFTISVFLIIGTLVVKKQMTYINQFDPGFETEQIVYTFLNASISKHFDVFKEKLLENSEVSGVTRCNNFIASAGSWSTVSDGAERNVSGHYFAVDEDFFDFFEIDFINGRNFNRNDVLKENKPYIINKKLADWYGSADTALVKEISNSEIVGIIDNIQVSNLYSEPETAVFQLKPEYTSVGYIKINSTNYKQTMEYIKSIWTEIAPAYPFEMEFLDESFEEIYDKEIQFSRVFLIFAMISIFLACLGLFALASFMSLKRTKEIGIRKALGSSTWSVALLLSKELTQWVLISNLIAAPLAYYLMTNWLNSFVYKTNLSWWIFVLAAVISLSIALITILYHTVKTARKNPVDSLRYE